MGLTETIKARPIQNLKHSVYSRKKKEEILIFTQILGECGKCEKPDYTYTVLR